MKFMGFLGCLIPTRLPFIEKTSVRVLDMMGIELVPMHGASCCVDPVVLKSVSREAWLAVAARNITLAEEAGMDILTLCNGCFTSLNEADHVLKSDPESKKRVNEALAGVGREYKGTVRVRHLADILAKLDDGTVEEKVVKALGHKVASHHGCHLMRPSEVARVDHPRHPTVLDRLVSETGGKPVRYSSKALCCGFGVKGYAEQTSSEMVKEILEASADNGADYIMTPCPMCFVQFDFAQSKAARPVPVLYVTEMLGLAFGLSPQEMGFEHHRVKVELPS